MLSSIPVDYRLGCSRRNGPRSQAFYPEERHAKLLKESKRFEIYGPYVIEQTLLVVDFERAQPRVN
jgi:hypothetical protein